MITIFSTPKDFNGEFDIIQKNAMSSWRAISEDIEIIIMGEAIGANEVAESINAMYIANVPVSFNGTPTIPGLFESAENNGNHDVYCFLNSDIILEPNFLTTIQSIYLNMKKFLVVGYRFNIDVKSSIDFSNQSESKLFFDRAQSKAVKGISSAIDIFCFTKGVFQKIPQFTVGRPGFDNWLLWKARRNLVPVIDITSTTKIFHQNHSYNFKGFKEHSNILNSQEAKCNKKLLGDHALTLNDANWILKLGKIRKKNDKKFKQRNLGKLPTIFPEFSIILKIYKKIYRRLLNLLN